MLRPLLFLRQDVDGANKRERLHLTVECIDDTDDPEHKYADAEERQYDPSNNWDNSQDKVAGYRQDQQYETLISMEHGIF